MIWCINFYDKDGHWVTDIERNYNFLPTENLTLEYPEEHFYKIARPPVLDLTESKIYVRATEIE